jgi:hypothetical protein
MSPAALAVDPVVWWLNVVRIVGVAALLLGYLIWRLWVYWERKWPRR